MGRAYSKYTDADLLVLLQKKRTESAAFSEIYDRYKSMLSAYAKCLVKDFDIAEDIFQESFVRLYKTLKKKSTENQNIPGLLVTICRNLAYNHTRDKKPKVLLNEMKIGLEETKYENKELLELILMAVEFLDEKYRKAFILREFEGRPFKEVAELEQINLGNAKLRVSTLGFFMTQGSIFLLLKTEGRLHARLTFLLKRAMIFFIISFAITTLYTLLFIEGVADKFQAYPVFFVLPLFSFLSIANIPRLVSKKKYNLALLFSSLTVAFLLMLAAFQLQPVLLPSTISPEYSLTIYNAASSQKSLGIMLTIVVIGAPLLALYFLFLYKTFNGKVQLDDTSY